MANRPAFLITIDTEGDNLWSSPKKINTQNSFYLYRFQKLCEKFNFKPTYLTNYEMAMDNEFVKLGRQIIRNNSGEIGMHLHAWNSPPLIPLTKDDNKYQPYLIEYEEEVVASKIEFMSNLLEDQFECKMTSHRAGRWAIDEFYMKCLKQYGYIVDCSVTPCISWETYLGNPEGKGGSNYVGFPEKPYLMSLDDISQPAEGQMHSLLQVPMTVKRKNNNFGVCLDIALPKTDFFRKVRNKLAPTFMFRSQIGNLDLLKWAVQDSLSNNEPYLEYMLHSSEFMPGGSPNFKSEADIEQLFSDLENLFNIISISHDGCTLSEYANSLITA